MEILATPMVWDETGKQEREQPDNLWEKQDTVYGFGTLKTYKSLKIWIEHLVIQWSDSEKN